MNRGFWRHDRFMDVFIEVLFIEYKDAKRTKLKVNWWNQGYTGNPWIIQPRKTIEIQTKDLKYWKQYSPKTVELPKGRE